MNSISLITSDSVYLFHICRFIFRFYIVSVFQTAKFSTILFLFRISFLKSFISKQKTVSKRINATTKTLHQKHEWEKRVRSKSSSLLKHSNNKSDHDECSLNNYFVQLIQFGCGEKETKTIGQINIAKRNSKQIQHSVFSREWFCPWHILQISMAWDFLFAELANGTRTM